MKGAATPFVEKSVAGSITAKDSSSSNSNTNVDSNNIQRPQTAARKGTTGTISKFQFAAKIYTSGRISNVTRPAGKIQQL